MSLVLRQPARSIGRFAPSPTGDLHFGSVIAALGSYLQARHHGGEWLVRIEDLDPPREQPQAAKNILLTLERLGLHWDREVIYQSNRLTHYQAVLAELAERNLVYGCACSRKEIGSGPYPGTCSQGLPPHKKARSVRLRTPCTALCFQDAILGKVSQDIRTSFGDFVVRRADGLFAYHLAVVVDDAAQGVTEIVRGADLLSATAPHVYLQSLLNYPQPRYLHLPVAITRNGKKLSKQHGAPGIRRDKPAETLWNALVFLGQDPPHELRGHAPEVLLNWGTQNWGLEKIPKVQTLWSAPYE